MRISNDILSNKTVNPPHLWGGVSRGLHEKDRHGKLDSESGKSRKTYSRVFFQ